MCVMCSEEIITFLAGTREGAALQNVNENLIEHFLALLLKSCPHRAPFLPSSPGFKEMGKGTDCFISVTVCHAGVCGSSGRFSDLLLAGVKGTYLGHLNSAGNITVFLQTFKWLFPVLWGTQSSLHLGKRVDG